MPNMSDYMKYAEAAFAAYATGLQLGRGINANAYRDADMSSTQAQQFDATWQVLGQQDLSDGFSAVLFQPVDVLGNPVGQKVLAIRGTEASHWGIDYLVDVVNVAYFGTAAGMRQYASLESFYQSLIAQGKLGATENFVTTGHSLGGFLAQAFAAKHIVVSAAYTYNAPGFSAAPGAITNYGTELLKLFGLSGTIPNDKIFNVRAQDGMSATAGLGQMIGSVQPVNIESGDPIHNHSIATLTDALAIYALYAELAPSLSIANTGALLKSASNTNARTLENTLDALRKTLLGASVTDTAVGDREALYANLYALQDSAAYKALKGNAAMRVLANADRDTLVAKARSDFGTFLAVRYLLPVALEGSSGVLGTVHTDLYVQWQADQALTPQQRQQGAANFSDEYLADRAAMLAWKLKLAAEDAQADATAYSKGGAPDAWFRDNATNLTINLGSNWSGPSDKRRFLFDGDGANTLSGGSLGDRLLGSNGNDLIYGEDRLQDALQQVAYWVPSGVRGDWESGGLGDDLVVGSPGNDVLFGGKVSSRRPARTATAIVTRWPSTSVLI